MPRLRHYETDAERQAAHRARRAKRERESRLIVEEAIELCEASGMPHQTVDEITASLRRLRESREGKTSLFDN